MKYIDNSFTEGRTLFSRLAVGAAALLLIACPSDDDVGVSADPVASLAAPTSATIAEPDGTANIEISLTPAPTGPVTVTLNISPAPDGGDYAVSGTGITTNASTASGLPMTVAFDADNSTRTLTITANEDDDIVSEALTVSLVAGDGYRFDSGADGSSRSLTITDDDIPVASLAAPSSATIAEAAGTADIAISLVPAPIGPVTVTLNISPAPDNADYAVSGDGIAMGTATGTGASSVLPVTVAFDADNAGRTLTITAAADDADGIDEVLTITLQDGSGYLVDNGNDERMVTIIDDELVASFFGDPTNPTIEEATNSATKTTDIEIRLSEAPGTGNSIDVRVSISPATDMDAYAVSGTGVASGTAVGGLPVWDVTFGAADTSLTLTIATALDDDNADEVLTVTLIGGTDYRVGASDTTRTVNITDDNIPLLNIEFRNIVVGGSPLIDPPEVREGAGVVVQVRARLSRNNDTGGPIIIPHSIRGTGINTDDFTVNVAALDANPPRTTVVIAMGSDFVELTSFGLENDADTGAEMLEVIISSGAGFRLPGNADEHKFILTILDPS